MPAVWPGRTRTQLCGLGGWESSCAAWKDGGVQLCLLGGRESRSASWEDGDPPSGVRPVLCRGLRSHGAARAHFLAERALWRPENKCQSGPFAALTGAPRSSTWLSDFCLWLKLHTGKIPQLECFLPTVYKILILCRTHTWLHNPLLSMGQTV